MPLMMCCNATLIPHCSSAHPSTKMKSLTVLAATAAATASCVDAFAIPAYNPAAPQVETVRMVEASPATSSTSSSSSLLSSTELVDKEMLKSLEAETKKAEKEARKDRIRAQRELNNERYFQYEAKMAEETEARVRTNVLSVQRACAVPGMNGGKRRWFELRLHA